MLRPNVRRRARVIAIGAVLAAVLPLAAQLQDRPDLDAIYRFKDEGFQRSQAMTLMSYLTDVYGPRLTGSPGIKAAAEYAVKELKGWGLANVKMEPWGPFGRGWSNERFTAMAVMPQAYPLIGYPKAWTPGTNGVVKGEAIMASIREEKGPGNVPRAAPGQVRPGGDCA